MVTSNKKTKNRRSGEGRVVVYRRPTKIKHRNVMIGPNKPLWRLAERIVDSDLLFKSSLLTLKANMPSLSNRLLERSVQKGNQKAMFFFAKRSATQMYTLPIKQIVQSIAMLERNVNQLFPNRLFYLACLYLKLKNFEKGVQFLQKSVDEGSVLAKARLGRAMLRGDYNITKNPPKGLDLLQESLTVPEANFSLGVHCLDLNALDDAENYFKKGMTQKFDPYCLSCQHQYAKILIKKKSSLSHGLRLLYQAGKLLPEAHADLGNYILLKAKEGKFDKNMTVKLAIDVLHQAAFKGNVRAFLILLSRSILRGFFDKAKAMIESMSKRNFTSGFFLKEYCLRKGFLYKQNTVKADFLKKKLQSKSIHRLVSVFLNETLERFI